MQKLDHKAIGLFFLQYISKSGPFALGGCILIFMVLIFSRGSTIGSFGNSGLSFLNIDVIFVPVLVSLSLFFLYLILVYLWAFFYYNSYRYEITDDSFKQEYGVFSREFISVPYDNIQDIEIRQDVFLRMLGLAGIHIQTAGSGNTNVPEITLQAIDIRHAKELRDELAKRVDMHK